VPRGARLMKPSELRLICKCAQWLPKEMRTQIPRGIRGIYALHCFSPRLDKYDVVYIGMANGKRGIRSRLASHARSKRKRNEWSHFSFFEVWPNITENEIEELEGLFREIYRKDAHGNRLARQKRYRKLRDVRISHNKIQAGLAWPKANEK
jgi:hypothetical protein